jgi:hypothetical protein
MCVEVLGRHATELRRPSSMTVSSSLALEARRLRPDHHRRFTDADPAVRLEDKVDCVEHDLYCYECAERPPADVVALRTGDRAAAWVDRVGTNVARPISANLPPVLGTASTAAGP